MPRRSKSGGKDQAQAPKPASARRQLTIEQRERKNARDRERRAERKLESAQAELARLDRSLKRSKRADTKRRLRDAIAVERRKARGAKGKLRDERRRSGEGNRRAGRGDGSEPSSRLALSRKPPRDDWRGPFRKFTTATPRRGNFQGIALIRARFESRPSKKPLVIPVSLGWTNRAELRELGRDGVLDLVSEIKPSALDVELVGVVALKPRKDRKGIRVRRGGHKRGR